MSNVIEFQVKPSLPEMPAHADERSYHQYVLQLEQELLDAKNALADMAISLFHCQQRLGVAPS